MQFEDPDGFQAHMAAASPGTRIRALHRPFRTEVSIAMLPRMALFSVSTVNFLAQRAAAGDIWSVTLPLRGGFSAAIGGAGRQHVFAADELYLLHPDRDFDYRAPGECEALVANILAADLQTKAAALAGAPPAEFAERIPATSPAGGALTRFAHHLWSELHRPHGLWDSPTALAEMEDCLVSLLALAANGLATDYSHVTRLAVVRRAEDYLIRHLMRPVTRSDLARAAGASIRTVSRGFLEHHGVSPMAWLKARRLEAAHRELCAAQPGEVTVTEVAVRYGFANLGRFAADYRMRFGETPSQTLRG